MSRHDPASTSPPARVAVLGLGPMGRALARTLAAAGHPVTAWNRSPRPDLDLGRQGRDGDIELGTDAADAVSGADVVVVCVRDVVASGELLAALPVPRGVPVVDLSSGTPDATAAAASAASARGLAYLTGAIMVPTPLVGTDDNLVLYAGPPAVVARARGVLEALGGTVDVLGEDHALPAALDLAMLEVYFAGMYAFLHSAALVRAQGVEPSSYLPHAAGILDTLAAELPSLATAYESESYGRGQASLGMCEAFLARITSATVQASLDPRLPALLRTVTAEQLERSGPDVDWDAVASGLSVPQAPEPSVPPSDAGGSRSTTATSS